MTPSPHPRRIDRLLSLSAFVLCTALVAAACPKPKPAPAAKDVTVFLSGDLRGYLEPCGCSENMLGGIHRAAGQIALARKEGRAVVVADAGDTLFPHTTLAEEQVPQAERKARAIAEAFTAMGNDGLAVGEKDLARGPAFLATVGVPTLMDAGRGPEGAPSVVFKDADGVKVALVSAGAANAAEALRAGAAQAREQGAAVVVALVHLSLADTVRLVDSLPAGAIDIAIAGHSESELDGEENRAASASVPVLQVMSKGRALARLDFHLHPGAPAGFARVQSEDERTAELDALRARIARETETLAAGDVPEQARVVRERHLKTLEQRLAAAENEKPAPPKDRSWMSWRFIKLDDQLPANEQVKQVIARYTKDVARLNLAWAQEHGKDCPPAQPGQAAFVGDAACRDCHEDAFKVWGATGHSHAWMTLEKADKQFDLDCVRCHVTGMNEPGGVCRVDKTEGRQDVQCESCHGPGSLHVDAPDAANVVGKPGEASCKGCHNPENSVNFDFATYLPKILGPGHGQPAQDPTGPGK